MSRAKGTANLAASLEVLAGAPLDAREKVPTKADLYVAANFPYPYVGLETYVVAENKKYRLVGNDVTVEANWEEVGSGGGGGTTVVANPEGTATDNLNKLQVGNDIYSIPQGGSAGDVATDWFIRNGMKNLAKLTEASAVSRAITYAIDKDAGTVTVDGTNSSSSDTSYTFAMIVPQGYFQPGQYKLNGHPGENTNVAMRIRYNNGSGNVNLAIANDIGDVAFEITEAIAAAATGGYNIMIAVAGGATADNVVLRPQIRYASVTDDSLENYTPTNKELKDMLEPMPAADMGDIVTPLPGVMSRTKIYSPEEQVVAEWREYVDGVLKKKPVYEKVVFFGALPKNTTKTVAHGISNLDFVVTMSNSVTGNESGFSNLPQVNDAALNAQTLVIMDSTNISIRTSSDRSAWSRTTLVIQYTKTTDEWEVV